MCVCSYLPRRRRLLSEVFQVSWEEVVVLFVLSRVTRRRHATGCNIRTISGNLQTQDRAIIRTGAAHSSAGVDVRGTRESLLDILGL